LKDYEAQVYSPFLVQIIIEDWLLEGGEEVGLLKGCMDVRGIVVFVMSMAVAPVHPLPSIMPYRLLL
jgi:hypothetical protein